MAGRRKTPQLRFDGRYYVANIYQVDGKRNMISFGGLGERTEGQIHAAFGKWLDLYNQQPHKVLSFKNPYEAIEQIVNPSSVVTVGELIEKYETHRKKVINFVNHNLEHPDFRFIKRVRQFLKAYKDWPIDTLGPDELESIRSALINHKYVHGKVQKRYTRRGINDVIKWIRRIWRWGMGRQLVKPEQIQGFEEVRALKMGDTDAPDNRRRGRVTRKELDKVVVNVPSVVADMLKLIWHTGMRPQEVCKMRPYDIVCEDSECWLYIPERDRTPVGKHKTTRYERVKVIPLTAECQKILAPRIKDFNSKQYIFSPKESMARLQEQKSAARRTPLNWGNRPGSNRKEHPMIRPGEQYNNGSLCQACKRGCERAGVEKFVPYDLRRTMATGTRAVLGKEAAKVLLGHTKTDTTDIYLLEEVQEAIKVAKLLAPKRETV